MQIDLINNSGIISENAIRDLLKNFSDALEINLDHKIIEIEFVSQEEMRHLNFEHMHKDQPTDVLSFPQSQNQEHLQIYGTIVICPDVAKQESITIEELIKHGLLHLSGFDHDSNQALWNSAASKINHEMGVYV